MSIKSTLSIRMLVVIGVTALVIALPVVALMQESAVAAPPPPLRGPFKFVEVPQKPVNAAGASAIYFSPLYTETFDGPIAAKPGWSLEVNTTITNTPDQHMWEYVAQSNYPGQPFTHTLWSASLLTGRPVNYTVYADSTYLPWMDTWAIYGPLDRQTYRQFQATFSFYLDTDPGAKFGWAASSDGTNFCGQSLSGHVGKWITATFDLASCPGDTNRPVYLAFLLQSNGDTPNGLGAFVDNLTIGGAPWIKSYMPFIRRDPTPTVPPASPTPPFAGVRSWDFEPNSDNSAWCLTSNSDDWSAGTKNIGGSLSTFYILRVHPSEYLAMLSPRYSTPANYRIAAQFNFLRFDAGRSLGDYGSAQFGLIFGVDAFGFPPGDGQQCSWGGNADGSWYKFMLKIKDGGGGYVTRLERFDQNQGFTLLNESNLPAGLSISRSNWNTMILDRNGSGIVASINGIQVLSLSDGTYKGSRWFGIFTETQGNNANSVFESDWDNIQVYNLTP